MTAPIYVPIIKSKQSEMLGLHHLNFSIKQRIFPLVDLAAPNKEKDKADATKFVERNVKGLCRYLNGFTNVMLDSSEMDTGIKIGKNQHPMEKAASLLQEAGITVIPVVGLSRDKDHLDAAKSIARRNKDKVVSVRLDDYDLETPSESATKLIELMRETFSGFQVYLLYDFRDVFAKDSAVLASRAVAVTTKLKGIQPIATIVAGCGIPERIAQAVSSRSAGYVTRVEIGIWSQYQKAAKSGQIILLGDYTTVTPDHTELDWRLISKTMGPKIIYALKDQWFVIRGGAFARHPLGRDQYFELAKSVTKLPEYPGEEYCYGDGYIGERSRKHGTCGNGGTWITACVNRHITLTVNTLE